MTRPRIEPQSPGPLGNTLPTVLKTIELLNVLNNRVGNRFNRMKMLITFNNLKLLIILKVANIVSCIKSLITINNLKLLIMPNYIKLRKMFKRIKLLITFDNLKLLIILKVANIGSCISR